MDILLIGVFSFGGLPLFLAILKNSSAVCRALILWCLVALGLIFGGHLDGAKNAYAQQEVSLQAPIGILTALPQELTTFADELTDFHQVTSGDQEFFLGKIGTVEVVMTISGGGKVNAAMTVQKLISEFSVKAMMFTGVAGGINPSYEIGDIVIARQAFQHDYGWFGEKFIPHAVGTMPELGVGSGEETIFYDLAGFWPVPSRESAGFLVRASAFFKELQDSLNPVVVNGDRYMPKVWDSGVVATGDQFIANNIKKNELQKLGADLVDMEGAAVAQVASKSRVPCLIVRALSDKAGLSAEVDFEQFFSVVAANNMKLISHLLRDDGFSQYLQTM